MNLKEQKRLLVLNRITQGKLNGQQGADLLGLSVRHLRRMLAGYRKLGAEALAHGNRGKPSTRRIEEDQRGRIVSLARGEYAGVNQQHFTELLVEREQLVTSRSTVRRVLADAGISSPRKQRRRRRHRLRRERYPQEGMLVQIDGSRHDWLEGRGPRMTLLAGVDDATGKVVGALFRPQEDSQGYFMLLRQIVEQYGRPLALYRDRHSIFQENKKKLSVEEQLRGGPEPTQFGRLLDELEIRSIRAWSPQAKGRVERLFGTLQDRLVTEFRLNNVSTPEAAQQFLDQFLSRFNGRFVVKASDPGRAYRKLHRSVDPDTLFSFKFQRLVASDNTVRIGDDRIQLESDSHRVSYARTRVQVQIRMDGHIAVYYQNRCLASRPAPPEAPLLRLQQLHSQALLTAPASSPSTSSKKKTTPPSRLKSRSKDHPWYRPYKKMKPETLYPAGDIFIEHLR